MANVEIDNKKMWEYLLNNSKDPNLVEDIANGLRAQGYDDEDYKVWAAQDAQVALALARKQLISEGGQTR